MWKDDKASGAGILEYANGDFYDGQWELDQRYGPSVRPSVRLFHRPLTLTYPTLSYCAGWGKFTSSETGSVYEGFWKDGVKVSAPPHLRCADLTRPTPLQDGTGTMFLSNGDSFSGSWEQGVIKGAVVYKFGDKSPWNDPEY